MKRTKAHDTHHPIDVSTYYEEQKKESLDKAKVFRDKRIPKFLKHFESNIQDNGFLTKDGPSYADLALFHVFEGVRVDILWSSTLTDLRD